MGLLYFEGRSYLIKGKHELEALVRDFTLSEIIRSPSDIGYNYNKNNKASDSSGYKKFSGSTDDGARSQVMVVTVRL
jgi:hypothetical protein